MTRELKNVLELIDDLKASSLVNVQILKKSLGEINGRLEEISDAEELIFIRNSIADFKDSLDNKFHNIFEQIKSLKDESVKDESALQNAELFEERFQALAGAFATNINNLAAKIEAIEGRFSDISDSGVQAAREEFLKISDELRIFHQEMSIALKTAQENTAARVALLAEGIKLVSDNVNSQTGSYKELLEHKIAQINELIDANSETLKYDNEFLKSELQVKFKELEEANHEYTNDLETIKSSLAEVLNKSDKYAAETSGTLQQNFDSITIMAQDTLCGIRNLQDYAQNLTEPVKVLIDYTENNRNEDVIKAVKDLDLSAEMAGLLEKVDIINNNFNIKSEFLEDQVLQMKTMFSDISIDIQNKEAELLEKEAQRVKQYYDKIELVADAVTKLEESLKFTGLEYKEQISALNKDLNEFVAEFNSIYNEVSNTAQMEITHSLEELKQFMNVNSTNYNDKLVIIQEQFTQAFRDLYEIVNKNNSELTEAGVQAKELNDASVKLLESLETKIDVIAATDYSENFEILSEQNEETQELVKILQSKVDKLLTTDFNALPEKQKIVNTQLLDYLQELNDKITIIGQDKVTESNTLNQLLLLAQPEEISNADLLTAFEDKIAELTKIALAKKDTEVLELNEKILSLINEIDAKLDVLATIDYEENFDELLDKVSETQEMVSESKKLITGTNENVLTNRRFLEKNQDLLLETKKLISDNSDMLLTNSLSVNENRSLLDELHAKLDVFVSTSDTEALEDELAQIREIILEQRQILGEDRNSVVSENIDKLLTRIDGISKTIDEHDENSAKIKEDLVNTIVSVFSSSNFTEETEEIKDFVEEKTGELSQQLISVQSQIQTIKQNEIADYSYTLADVESDIAKLRLVLNDISSSTSCGDINQISRNIHNLTSSIESISKNLTPAEIYQLKTNILKLNEDILSISSRTNKLLLNSDEAQKTISEGLLAFSHMAYNLEERMNELSNKEFNAEMAEKLERMTAMLETSASMDNTFHKAMMFLGEWVDAASETIESINDKADEINDVSEALSQLRKIVPEKLALIDMLEERFEEQQSRMDRLETKLDELMEQTSQNNTLSIAQKMERMEKIIYSMSNSIEKLTAYVD